MKLGQPCQRDLERSVAGNKGGKFSQALLAAATNTHLESVSRQKGKVHCLYQHHVSSRIPNDPRNLDEIDDRIREKHQVHAGPSQDFVVLEIVLKLNQIRFRVGGYK